MKTVYSSIFCKTRNTENVPNEYKISKQLSNIGLVDFLFQNLQQITVAEISIIINKHLNYLHISFFSSVNN